MIRFHPLYSDQLSLRRITSLNCICDNPFIRISHKSSNTIECMRMLLFILFQQLRTNKFLTSRVKKDILLCGNVPCTHHHHHHHSIQWNFEKCSKLPAYEFYVYNSIANRNIFSKAHTRTEAHWERGRETRLNCVVWLRDVNFQWNEQTSERAIQSQLEEWVWERWNESITPLFQSA